MPRMRSLTSLWSLVGAWLFIQTVSAAEVAAQAAPQPAAQEAPNPYDERGSQQPIVVNIVQQQQQAQVVQDRRPRRTPYARVFDVTLLSPSEQARYWELEGSRRRRIGFPVALTAVSGAGVLAVFVAYAALAGMTCEDYDTGEVTDCSMPPGALGFAAFPAIGVAIGAVMLARRVPWRREFRALTRKGTRIEPLALREGAGLGLSGSF